ncbi:hypothetical protein M413DRAFT_440629 [Hebeloma cylindrosporum]|uniref:Uncharacterized protein n=1 Tax=Hebeloma cylindrosporum TaxID=76867 RepID=A0A0C3CSS1_HEBCY|nr:hypothetical protein M413DRAFT_440629 [Hebeloma cylindrosporum h7]
MSNTWGRKCCAYTPRMPAHQMLQIEERSVPIANIRLKVEGRAPQSFSSSLSSHCGQCTRRGRSDREIKRPNPPARTQQTDLERYSLPDLSHLNRPHLYKVQMTASFGVTESIHISEICFKDKHRSAGGTDRVRQQPTIPRFTIRKLDENKTSEGKGDHGA